MSKIFPLIGLTDSFPFSASIKDLPQKRGREKSPKIQRKFKPESNKRKFQIVSKAKEEEDSAMTTKLPGKKFIINRLEQSLLFIYTFELLVTSLF